MINHQIQMELGVLTVNESALYSLFRGVVNEYFLTQSKNRENTVGMEFLDTNNTQLIESEQGGVDANIHVQMTYGALLPEIVPDLCSTIQRDIHLYASLEVKNINIFVDKIRVPEAIKSV